MQARGCKVCEGVAFVNGGLVEETPPYEGTVTPIRTNVEHIRAIQRYSWSKIAPQAAPVSSALLTTSIDRCQCLG